MTFRIALLLALVSFALSAGWSSPASMPQMLVFMDRVQSNHLKAYGVAFRALKKDHNVEWLLNYRGGSFVMPADDELIRAARLAGVGFTLVDAISLNSVYTEIEAGNMDRMLLEKAPDIAVYTRPDALPWDDAVTMALDYAEVPYTKLWDEEALMGKLELYDWLHLHHEDFTGQYSKLYAFRNTSWYQQHRDASEIMARKLSFSSVPEEKKAVARAIRAYVAKGGFLFAMCSATETLDIALSAESTDIVPAEYDNTPVGPDCQSRLDYGKTFAFENFTLQLDPHTGSFSDIDVNQINAGRIPTGAFTLFDYSAKFDPVATMLTQNHVNRLPGFYGLLTAFNRRVLKGTVLVLAGEAGADRAKYIHGSFGRGTFTFYGGHDPEDEEHLIGDPPTNLSLHRNSPGYRLILNNILFPAARYKHKQKT